MTQDDNPLIGRGWRWPVGVDPAGGIALSSGDAEVEEAIYLILATTPGERPMRPEFGCNLQHFVFLPIEAGMLGLLAQEVRAALRRWEPRIQVSDVITTPDPNDDAAVLIDIRYEVSASYDRRSLVVPFYTIPAEERATA